MDHYYSEIQIKLKVSFFKTNIFKSFQVKKMAKEKRIIGWILKIALKRDLNH